MADIGVKKVLFVCLGNICRSPIAEAVFKNLVEESGADMWEVDSAGTGGWHVGNPPDSRAAAILIKHGLSPDHRARQIKANDFCSYDFIIGMDPQNMKDLNRIKPKDSKVVLLNLANFDPNKNSSESVPDPYYDSGSEGFEACYHQCMRCCKAFLEKYKSK